jgi:hypothetical protein
MHKKAVARKVQYLLVLALVAVSILVVQGAVGRHIATALNTMSAEIVSAGVPAS